MLTIGGPGDLETSLEYEFIHERRYRPAVSATSIIRWPTASDPDLGTPGRDYSLGLIIYGWNDIADAEIDKFNPRKGTFLFGARGSQEQLRRLPLQIALAQAIFAAIFLLLTGPKILL